MKTIQIGKKGEDIARKYLQNKGYIYLSKNWRYKNHHEIDLVMVSPEGDLVAVEVRSRQQKEEYAPFESIDAFKIRQICQSLEKFILAHDEYAHFHARMDVVSVVIDSQEIEHFESVNIS